jgi:hypothetical protein
MQCPNCGTESRGKFCHSCGASLQRAACSSCGGQLVPGARFCNSCGTEAGGTPRRAATPVGTDRGNLPWYIAGAVLLVLIIVLLLPMLRGDDTPARGQATFGGATAPGAAPGTPPPLAGSPREQADQLFNRIMREREAGNIAEAQRFTPMAIDAYRMSEPLDDDGLYHLAAVQNVAGNHDEALAVAERILSRNPNHLLALAVAAESREGAGDPAAARAYHRRLLDAYETEVGRQIPEYLDHAGVLPEYRARAQAGAQGS